VLSKKDMLKKQRFGKRRLREVVISRGGGKLALTFSVGMLCAGAGRGVERKKNKNIIMEILCLNNSI
jgi:hypothetical protein